MKGSADQIAKLQAAIAAQEALRPTLGDEAVDVAIAALREKLAALESQAAGPVPKRRQVTLLFADLAGFTPMAEKMDPEDVHGLMDAYFSALTPAIARYGGRVEKFIGDAVLAVFGLPTTHEDDPANAVRAALAMQHNLARLNAELWQRHGLRLTMRVGLNTGLVIASLLGGHKEENYTVIGDAVNLAARLQQAAPPGGILVSQATYDQVRGLFEVEALPPLSVKGKSKPVQTYLIHRARPRAFHMPTRGLAGVTTRTVGRDAELALLQDAYRRAAGGQGLQWITVSGEAGVGKTRLLTDFEHWLQDRPEAIWYLKGRAWPHSQNMPYFLLRDLVSAHFQILDGDPLGQAREKLATGLGALLGSELGQEAAAFCGQLIGLDFRHSPWIAPILDDTRQIRGRAGVLLRAYLDRLSKNPIVILLEDLHWADAESLAFLATLLAEPRPPHLAEAGAEHCPRRLCVVGSARPEFWQDGSPWQQAIGEWAPADHRRLDLVALPGELALELVLELLQKVEAPPAWLLALLIDGGAGNPYFTEELVHWLIEQRVIEAGQGQWQVLSDQAVGLSVPSTVQGVLQARLERLSPQERLTLQHAAVVGRVFWKGAVSHIGQQAVPEQRWVRLEQRDLIFGQAASQLPGEQEYHFKHVLLQEVIYEHTLKRSRRAFHKRAAEWLIQKAADRADEWAAIIARHWEHAGEARLAATWYGRAGKHAQATYAPQAAIDHYQKALAALDTAGAEDGDQGARVAFYDGLGAMLRLQTHYQEALRAFAAMRQAAESAGDPGAQAQAWRKIGAVQGRQGDFQAALASIARATEIAAQADPPFREEIAAALSERGMVFVRSGDAEATLAVGARLQALARAEGNPEILAESLNLLGAAHWILGNYDQAGHHFAQALDLCREAGNRWRQQKALNNLGANAYMRGDYARAAQLFEESLSTARQTGDRDGEILAQSNLGGALAGLGDGLAAQAHLEQVIQMAPPSGWYELSNTYRFLAEAFLAQDRVPDAVLAARRALEMAQEMAAPDLVGRAWRMLGRIAARGGAEWPGAPCPNPADCFAESLRMFSARGAEGERARTLHAWARFEIEQGDRPRGQTMWDEARQLFAQLGMARELEEMGLPLSPEG